MKAVILFQLLAACAARCAADELTVTKNANHIFNAVHNAMRQWGSSVQHNGMTAFIATVPADTELYHGTGIGARVNGTQWLAFEPEHALLFASSLHGSPPGSKRPPPSGKEDEPSHKPRQPSQERLLHHDPHAQVPLRDDGPKNDPPAAHGYLHTYRTRHALRLIYVDGQSAAKSTMGTLDLQDVVILDGQLGNDDRPGPGGPMHEHERAQGLCKQAAEQWQDKIDGILRMEGGFEIILCSFAKHLDVVSIKRTQDRHAQMHTVDPNLVHPKGPSTNMLDYYKAVASRYDGIGGNRVNLDFNHGMLSLYAYPNALVIDKEGRPRADNKSASMKAFRHDLDVMVSSTKHDLDGVEWQAISDLVVSRYSDRLVVMSKAKSLSDLRTLLEIAFAPFIDYSNRSVSDEIMRCASKDLPKGTLDTRALHELSYQEQIAAQALSSAGVAVAEVSYKICSTLHEISQKHSLSTMLKDIQKLRTWLDWPIWKRCRGCTAEEVCFTPVWPAGSIEDYQQPKCKSLIHWDDKSDSYWRDR